MYGTVPWDCPIRVYCSHWAAATVYAYGTVPYAYKTIPYMYRTVPYAYGTVPNAYTVATGQQLQYICVWDYPICICMGLSSSPMHIQAWTAAAQTVTSYKPAYNMQNKSDTQLAS